MTSSTFSRRDFYKIGAGAAAAIAMPSIARADPDSLVVSTTGGKTEEALVAAVLKPFTEKTGIKIITTSSVYAKVRSMVEAKAVEWDVFFADGAINGGFGKQGLLEPIDYSVIDKSQFIPGGGNEFYIKQDIAPTVIAWNTRALKGDARPNTWAEFWDTKLFPGQRGFWKQPQQSLELALLADGVPRDKLYPLDLDRAFHSLEKLKPNNLYWWTAGAQGVQLLIDGEFPLSMGWTSRLSEPRSSGAPIDYTLNDALLSGNSWAIIKGARNVAASTKLIAFGMEAKQQAEYCKILPYGPINTGALKLLSPERLKEIPSDETLKHAVFQDNDWWADNGPKVAERFNKWLLT